MRITSIQTIPRLGSSWSYSSLKAPPYNAEECPLYIYEEKYALFTVVRLKAVEGSSLVSWIAMRPLPQAFHSCHSLLNAISLVCQATLSNSNFQYCFEVPLCLTKNHTKPILELTLKKNQKCYKVNSALKGKKQNVMYCAKDYRYFC